MNRIYKTLLLAVAVLGLAASCNNAGNNKGNTQKKTLNELNVEDVFFDDQKGIINYKIPSPLEMFLRLQRIKAPFKMELPNKPINSQRYITQYQQAVNMGVYASDMAYCCILGDSQNTLVYFNMVKNMSVEVGLYEGVNKELADRVLDNLSESDTLISITAESYYEVVNYIEEQGLGDIQCLVVAGSWIESIYLCLKTICDLKIDKQTMEIIEDHQVILENLAELLEQNKQDRNVAKLLEEIKAIQTAYDVNYQNEGKMLTQKQFSDIVNAVSDARERIIM